MKVRGQKAEDENNLGQKSESKHLGVKIRGQKYEGKNPGAKIWGLITEG